MRIGAGSAVTIEYELAPEGGGHAVEASEPGAPLTFLFGTGRVLPGLEHLLFGLEAGTSIEGEIAPEDAYGWRDEALVESVPRERFGAGGPPEVGAWCEARHAGRVRYARVTAHAGDEVVLDLNHPLAGVGLVVRARVLRVRAATPAELATGRVIESLSADAP